MRTSRDPAPIPASTRKEVLDRDGNKCRWCGTKSGLHLHHINYRSEGVDHSPQNLITLCHSHHSLVHSKKGVYKPLLRAYIWERYVNDNRWTLPILKKKLDRQTLRAGTKPSSI